MEIKEKIQFSHEKNPGVKTSLDSDVFRRASHPVALTVGDLIRGKEG